MNRHSHQFTTDARPWDYESGVLDCSDCDGEGGHWRKPFSSGNDPDNWLIECDSCDGQGFHACATCGFDVQVDGYDCIVCQMVHDLSPANMKRINPADIADAFAQAVNAALNAQVPA